MNIAETAGGSSCKGQENGDASNESERPLKKARFAWQVKGKYHLKNDSNDTAKTSTASTPDQDAAESSESRSSNHNRDTEQKLEILEDYLRKQDFGTLDTVIVAPEQPLTPSTSISNEKLPYPRYVSSYEQSMSNNGLSRSSESSSNNMNNTLPISMVVSQSFTEDQCIARWHTKQMVKSFLDNAINRVLDIWIQAPLPTEVDRSRSVALDVADFINNLPEDNSVENEGILMAISAHGLQQPASSSSSDMDNNYLNRDIRNSGDDFRPLTPHFYTPSDDESHEQENNNQCDTDTSSNDLDLPWSYTDDQKTESNDMTAFPLFPDASSLSYPGVNNSHQNSSAECDGIDNNVNHCDFLDEAILFAIQSKGLTTFGSDYG